jgi:hypothetical protein
MAHKRRGLASIIMKLMFAQVAVNVPSVSGVYSYNIPDALAAALGPGSLVTVSFGAQTVQGVVLGLAETSPAARPPVLELLDPLPLGPPPSSNWRDTWLSPPSARWLPPWD